MDPRLTESVYIIEYPPSGDVIFNVTGLNFWKFHYNCYYVDGLYVIVAQLCVNQLSRYGLQPATYLDQDTYSCSVPFDQGLEEPVPGSPVIYRFVIGTEELPGEVAMTPQILLLYGLQINSIVALTIHSKSYGVRDQSNKWKYLWRDKSRSDRRWILLPNTSHRSLLLWRETSTRSRITERHCG